MANIGAIMPVLPSALLRWSAPDRTIAEQQGIHIEPIGGAQLLPEAPEGTLVAAPALVEQAFVEAIPSWQAEAPGGSTLEIYLRALVDGRWTRWWNMGVWSGDPRRRFSVEGQEDTDGKVATDTLSLRQPAEALQWRAVLRRGANDQSPSLRGFAVMTSPAGSSTGVDQPPAVAPLDVPLVSQMEAGERGPDLCSAAALTMALQYWYARTHDGRLAPFVAPDATERLTTPGVYDRVYDGAGNWAFNTAFAASLGLEAYVARLNTLAEVAAWTAAGVPVIASIAWGPGDLDDAPIVRSAGHLVVVVGVTPDGDVVVNEPRADTRRREPVRRVYRRAQFKRAWQGKGRGTVYLIYPPGWIA
jgi:hypothetical protein